MGESLQVNVPIMAPQEVPPAEPALIAGKFKSEDDLNKGILELIKKQQGDGGLEAYYKSLESQLGKPAEPKPATPGEPQPPEGTPPTTPPETPPENQVRDVLKDSGLDFDELSNEFATNQGKLSDASYEKLTKAGFPRQLVDTYIEGQMALASQRNQQIFNTVGGEEEYDAMLKWASLNLSEPERKAYNAAFDKTDIGQTMLAVEGLHAKYKKATGSTSDLIEPTGSRIVGGGYSSMSQMTIDMKDPRYKTDPAFRQMVADKIRKSNFV